MENTMPEDARYPCPACLVGRLQRRPITFTQVYAGTLVSAPNIPAWVCDSCRAVQIDPEALSRIEALVGQAGPPPNRARTRPAAQPRPRPRALPPRA